ncbi:MAG: hypothetical protein RMJ98_08080 [Myxococcales bacterium]|nr:hypothetical protein [Polyangiaceae bacterium]MDW8249244.1 hypothetical protein [Myxococcales bacterium]
MTRNLARDSVFSLAPPPMSALPTSEPDSVLPVGEAVHRVMIAVAIVGGVLVVGAAIGFGLRPAGSVALGAAAAVLNLFLLERVVAELLGGRTGGRAVGVGLGLVKFLLLFGGSWGLFGSGLAEALPFVAGFGALPLAILLSPFFLGGSSRSASMASPGAGGLPWPRRRDGE